MGLLLRSATLAGGSQCAGIKLSAQVTADVRVDSGQVAWIDPPGTLSPAPEDAVHDLSGYLLLPAPVEPHAHLDTALLAEGRANGDSHHGAAGPGDLLHRARRAAQLYLAHGATAVRTHVTVDGTAGLRALETLLRLRVELRGLMTLQVVALVAPDPSGCVDPALRREALRLGPDLAGGAPHLEPDPVAAVRTCLDAAAEAGVGVDLHLDAGPTAGPLLAELTRAVIAGGFPYSVTVASCPGTGTGRRELGAGAVAKPGTADLEAAAQAGISVVALPRASLALDGRGPRGASAPTPIRVLLDAGLSVAAGGGRLRDLADPMGRGDPLETASLLVTGGGLRPEEAYTAVTSTARAVMGLPAMPPAGTLENGVPADLLALRAETLLGAVAGADPDRTVISGGRLAVRTRVSRSFPVSSRRP